MHQIYGMRVFILPDTVIKTLSWKERLLSWPWEPWMKTQEILNPLILHAPYKIPSGEMFMTQAQYTRVKNQMGD
jgi:hypothetical protein